MSRPFIPAFTNDGPDHLTKAYVTENASVEKPIEATTGAPSPWKVLTSTPKEQPKSATRLHVSVLLKVADIRGPTHEASDVLVSNIVTQAIIYRGTVDVFSHDFYYMHGIDKHALCILPMMISMVGFRGTSCPQEQVIIFT